MLNCDTLIHCLFISFILSCPISMIISQLTFDLQSRLDVVFILVEHFDDEKAFPSNQWLSLHIGKWLGLQSSISNTMLHLCYMRLILCIWSGINSCFNSFSQHANCVLWVKPGHSLLFFSSTESARLWEWWIESRSVIAIWAAFKTVLVLMVCEALLWSVLYKMFCWSVIWGYKCNITHSYPHVLPLSDCPSSS